MEFKDLEYQFEEFIHIYSVKRVLIPALGADERAELDFSERGRGGKGGPIGRAAINGPLFRSDNLLILLHYNTDAAFTHT